jgi:mannose-6-phosphate isomerase-like protein (cupin superfamily)
MQLVVMMIKPGEEIGMEKHSHTSQFIRVESDVMKAIF